MKNWSTAYEILRFYVRFAFWLSHKQITVTGAHLIPEGKPIIFAPNHQNALMDPLALVCTNSHQSVWLVRADIFKLKAIQAILHFLKLLPVYRIRDGRGNLSNNEQIFAQVIQLLKDKKTVALFPEAAHSGKRQMLPHKKAIPRIALEAEKKNNFCLDIQIVPVGIYYSHYSDFNRSLIVQYGQPFGLGHYQAAYEENPEKAILSLRQEIQERLSPLTLQINSKTNYREYENIRQLSGEAVSKTRLFSKNPGINLFYAEKELIGQIEQIEQTQPKRFDQLLKETTEYFNAVKSSGRTDEQIKNASDTSWFLVSVQSLFAVLSLPLFLFGFVFNAIPFSIPRTILRQKVKDITFLSTFNFVTGLIVFPVFYLFATILLFKLTGSLVISVLTFILMPLTGKLAYQLLVFYRKIFPQFIFLAGRKSPRKTLQRLVKQRNKLIKFIQGNVIF